MLLLPGYEALDFLQRRRGRVGEVAQDALRLVDAVEHGGVRWLEGAQDQAGGLHGWKGGIRHHRFSLR
jgi:hypothetical protein